MPSYLKQGTRGRSRATTHLKHTAQRGLGPYHSSQHDMERLSGITSHITADDRYRAYYSPKQKTTGEHGVTSNHKNTEQIRASEPYCSSTHIRTGRPLRHYTLRCRADENRRATAQLKSTGTGGVRGHNTRHKSKHTRA